MIHFPLSVFSVFFLANDLVEIGIMVLFSEVFSSSE